MKRQARTWKSPRTRAVPGLMTQGAEARGRRWVEVNFHLVWARIHRFLQPGVTGRPGKVARLERILPQRAHVLGDKDTSRKRSGRATMGGEVPWIQPVRAPLT